MKNKLIFIIGTGHCGSTLLDLLLGSHSQAVSLGEICKVLMFRQDEPLCNLCGEKCNLWDTSLRKKLINYYSPSLVQRILSKLFQTQTTESLFYNQIIKSTGKNILIDSSKNAGWILRNGRALNKNKKYEPILVYLSRDGRAVVNSYFRKYPEKGLHNIATNWNNRIQKINDTYKAWDFGKKIHIKYENLAQEPVNVIHKVLNLIGLDYEPEMMRFWEHQHHLVSGNAGTKSMLIKFQKENEYKDWIKLNKKGYYKNHELGINFDERWKSELNESQKDEIEKVIFKLNESIKYYDS